MLNNEFFYNRTIRKIVIAFGTLFKDIDIVRTKENGTQMEKYRVPLSYGEKEKYLTRINADPTLTKSIASHVPRISFNLESLSYDPTRKQVTTLRNFSSQNGVVSAQYVPIPYTFDFNLSIYVRNMEDGTQILEQILPFFTPDFTVTVDFVTGMNQKYDIPIILNAVSPTIEYEGDFTSTRLITWDLSFSVKGYIWPALKNVTNGLIGSKIDPNGADIANNYGSVVVNSFMETQRKEAQAVYVDYANGSNYFVSHEVVRIENSSITGRVEYFANNETGLLILTDLNQFASANDVIIGDFSNAKYKINSVELEPRNVVTLLTTANPINATINDFGFSQTQIDMP